MKRTIFLLVIVAVALGVMAANSQRQAVGIAVQTVESPNQDEYFTVIYRVWLDGYIDSREFRMISPTLIDRRTGRDLPPGRRTGTPINQTNLIRGVSDWLSMEVPNVPKLPSGTP